jgi:hypothetical protein
MKHIGLMVAVSLASTLTCAGQHAFLVQNSGWMSILPGSKLSIKTAGQCSGSNGNAAQ